MSIYIFIIILSIFHSIICQPSSPIPNCDQSHSNQQITAQNALYWCSNGHRIPLACLSSDGSRIDIGSTYWTDTSILECRQSSTDQLQLLYVACLKNGR